MIRPRGSFGSKFSEFEKTLREFQLMLNWRRFSSKPLKRVEHKTTWQQFFFFYWLAFSSEWRIRMLRVWRDIKSLSVNMGLTTSFGSNDSSRTRSQLTVVTTIRLRFFQLTFIVAWKNQEYQKQLRKEASWCTSVFETGITATESVTNLIFCE